VNADKRGQIRYYLNPMSRTPTQNYRTAAEQALVGRLLAAVELMDFGVALMRQNITRKMPGAPPEKISQELRRWLIEQPEHFEVRGSTPSEDL